MAELKVPPPAARYLKKLKDKKLKAMYKAAIDTILENPFAGEEKTGDLQGIRGFDIYYDRTNHELAYTVEEIRKPDSGETEIVVVIMAGTRENFYDELKRYWPRRY